MKLYPRLSNRLIQPWMERLTTAPVTELEQPAPLLPRGHVFAPTGGTRMSEKELEALRKKLRAVAERCGYVYGCPRGFAPVASPEQKARLDLEMAKLLNDQANMTPNEAAQPGVWRYFGCVLGPELVRWRFDGPSTPKARFGGNRLRNFYGRLWWRAELLADYEHESDAFWLLAALGEDELVQITERPNAAGYRPLACGLGQKLLEVSQREQVPRMKLFREFMKRLLRLMPLLRFESLDSSGLDSILDELFQQTLEGMGHKAEVIEDPAVLPLFAAQGQPASEDYEVTPRADDESADVMEEPEEEPPEESPEPEELTEEDALTEELEAPTEEATEPVEEPEEIEQPEARQPSRFPGWLRADEPLPTHPIGPSLIYPLMERLELRTQGQLYELDLNAVAEIRGVGQTKIEALTTYREQVLAALKAEAVANGWESGPDAIEQEPVEDGAVPSWIPLNNPLPPVPGLLRLTLERAEVHTVQDLLELNLRDILRLKGVGRKKRDALEAFREEMLDNFWGAHLYRKKEPFSPREWKLPTAPEADEPQLELPDLTALDEHVRSELNDRERYVVRRRYQELANLREIGSSLALSRERVRQLQKRAVERAHRSCGPIANDLLLDQLNLKDWPSILHRVQISEAMPDFGWLHFLIEVATNESWQRHQDWLLHSMSIQDFRGWVSTLSEQLRGRMALSEEELTALLDDCDGISRPELDQLLRHELGWLAVEGGYRVDPELLDLGAWLVYRVCDAGRSVHQSEAGRWIVEREGGDTSDEEEVLRCTRRAEGMLDRKPGIYRCDQGSFIHERAMGLSTGELEQAVNWSVERLRGETGPYSTEVLLELLEAEGLRPAALNRYLLKDALGRHPEIRPLRKTLVAFEETFEEEGLFMQDRLEEILAEAREPLSVEEIMARLPEGIRYAETSVSTALLNGGFARRAAPGRYIAAPDPT